MVNSQIFSITLYFQAVNERRYVFHFRPKPNIWSEKHLALGRILKLNVQTYVYSHLSNNRGGWNKRGGEAKIAKSLNVEAGIKVEVGKYL